MIWVRKAIQYKNQIVFTAGLFFPAFVIFIYPTWFQPDDLDAFLRWSQDWAKGAQDIYVNCAYCNYPFLGMVFSAGAVDWLGIRDFDGMMGLFRYYLAFIDLLNVVVLYYLLRALKIKDAAFWSGIVGLLPSSWIGASYWGQIDNIGQFFILAFLLLAAKINEIPASKAWRNYLLAFTLGFLLSCLVMTKQLVFFSMISLGSMAVANIILVSRKWTSLFVNLFVLAASFAAPILLVDSMLKFDPQYISHLHYILATGSSHGDTISSFGFNLWTFFTTDPFGSSHEPLSVFGLSLIPYKAGIALFLSSVLLLSVAAVYFHLKENNKSITGFTSRRLGFWVAHLALVNLSFNLFLTGTHERYLYHFFPFAIVAILFTQKMEGLNRIVLIGGAAFYGVFLYGYLTGYNLYFDQVPYRIMSLLALYLLAFFTSVLFNTFLNNASSHGPVGTR
jgi:hypothetical protein